MLRNVTAWKSLVLFVAVISGGLSLMAQPADYTVAPSQGTYQQINAGTLWASGTALDDQTVTGVAIGFNFVFGAGTTTSTVNVNANGYISFGSAPAGNVYTPLSSTAASSQIVAAFARNLVGTANATLRTELLGVAPNRVFVIQWAGVSRPNSQYDDYNFQVRLTETSNTIDIVYGSMTTRGTLGAQVGMRGALNTQVYSLRADYDENSWARPRLSTTTAIESIAEEMFVPASGQMYRWSRRAGTINDVGVINIEGPTGKFNANTTQTVTARVKNFGTNAVDSFIVDWKVNGTTRASVKYYAQPALAANAEVVVTLGTTMMADRSWNLVEARTLSPNGIADSRASNDWAEGYRAPRVSGNFSVAKVGANAGVFTRFRDFVRHLKVSGINGSIVLTAHAGVYEESIMLDGVDATDASQTLTVNTVPGDEVIVEYPLHRDLSANYGQYEFPAILNVVFGSNLTVDGIEFRVTAGSQFQGGVLVPGTLQNFTIRNCTFTGLGSNTVIGNALELFAPFAANIRLENNTIRNHRFGFVCLPASVQGLTVSGNNFECISGVQVQSTGSGVAIQNNTVVVDNRYTGLVNAVLVTGTTSPRVSGNVVNGTASRDGLNGILVAHDNGTALIHNNMVAVAGTMQAIGIWIDARTNTSTNLYHNSVNATASTTNSAALYINNNELAFPNFTVTAVNNILHNVGLGTTGGPALWIADVNNTALTAATSPMQLSDFNDLYSSGAFPVRVINTAYTTLAGYRAAFLREQNSASVPVAFVGQTDLHLLTIQQQLFGSSAIIPSVPVDIDGDARVKPYMGADEISPVARFVQQPQSRYVCFGQSFTLVAVAEVTLGATIKYQWFKDGVKLVGRTSAILSFGNTGYDAAAVYHCEVEISDGTTTKTIKSDDATIMVVRLTSIATHPMSQPVAIGSTVDLYVEAEAVGTATELAPQFQWKKRFWNATNRVYQDSALVDNGRITGTSSSILTIRDITSADTLDTYFCTVMAYCGNVDSKVARLFVPRVIVSDNLPSACIGQPLQMEVGASPGAGNGLTLSYQWFHNGDALVNGGRVTGANGKVLNVGSTVASDNGSYYCVVSYGPTEAEIQSNVINVELGTAPGFTSQPTGGTICEGENMNLTSQAVGSNLTYQWTKNGVNVPGASGASLTVQNATASEAGTYNVLATNACGTQTSVTVEIVVDTKPTITTAPRDQAVIEGEPVNLTVEASGTGTLAYQWFRNGEKVDDATGATYQIPNATGANAGVYTVEVSNNCGTVTSNSAIVDVTVSVAGDMYVNGFMLGTASPNPTSSSISFAYEVASTQNVRIVMMDMLGRPVADLVNGIVEAGRHTVQLSVADLGLNQGVYMYTLQANGVMATQQVVVVR